MKRGRYFFLSLFLVFPGAACEERGEEGGMHGDRDLAGERSFDDPIDTPPVVSDSLDILTNEQLEEGYFAWGRFESDGSSKEAGSVILKLASDSLVGRVDLFGLAIGESYQLRIYGDHNCTSLLSDPGERTPIAIMNTISADEEGRVEQLLMNELENDSLKENSVAEMLQGGAVTLHSGREIVACTPLQIHSDSR